MFAHTSRLSRRAGCCIIHEVQPSVLANHLKRFWAQTVASRGGGNREASSADDGRADKVLLAGLRLGVRETLDFLINNVPGFSEFEQWVLAKNGGSIAPERVERLN